jgi:hypothetical protein
MKAIRRTKIRWEKHELTTIRFGDKARFFCEECQTEANHLTVLQTATMFAVSEKTIFRLADSRQIHSTETTSGQLLICAASAANFEK